MNVITDPSQHNLAQVIIELHTLAIRIDQETGYIGLISEDIRNCADRLRIVIKRITMEEKD